MHLDTPAPGDEIDGMANWFDSLRDEQTRTRIGHRFEALADEVFQVFRWILLVGFAAYVADSYPNPVLDAIHWGLAGLLFAALASRLLLRPEIRLVPNPGKLWQARLQTLLNMVICAAIFLLVMWGVQQMTDAAAKYRAIVPTLSAGMG